MKKIMIILAVMATVFASCSKIETSKTDTPSGNSELKFEGEICSIDGAATKAYVKTGWAEGDKLSVYYDKTTSNPLTLEYNGGKWKISEAQAPSDTTDHTGDVKVLYDGDVKVAATAPYQFKDWTLYFNVNEWTFLTQIQVVVSGLDETKAASYSLACDKFTPCTGTTVGTGSITAKTGTKGAAVNGISNADGVAFVFATTEEVTSGTDITFTLYGSTKKEYTLNNKAISANDKAIKAIKIDGTDSGKFKTVCPEGAVPGIFTVASGRKVYFSKGNLYWTGSAFKFENNQYDNQTSWATNHVSHFYWNSDAAKSRQKNVPADPTDKQAGSFFTNSTTSNTSPNDDFTVNGVKGLYRSLSDTEWQYLLNNHKKAWATVAGKNGYIIAPDGYNEDITKKTYSEDEWTAAENEGFVFLPVTGSRSGENTSNKTNGYYWTSKGAYSNKTYSATHEDFTSTKVSQNSGSRGTGYAVRLVRSAN